MKEILGNYQINVTPISQVYAGMKSNALLNTMQFNLFTTSADTSKN